MNEPILLSNPRAVARSPMSITKFGLERDRVADSDCF